jgi:hypothetical protein
MKGLFYHHQPRERKCLSIERKSWNCGGQTGENLLLCCGGDGDAVREALPSMNVATTLGIKLQAWALRFRVFEN